MAYEPLPVTPEIITWARQRAGYSLEDAQVDFKKIAQWEEGEVRPTYPQLEKLSDKFKVPIAVFFFPKPPDVPAIEQSFRTLGPDQIATIPPRVRLLLRKALTFQMSLEELNQGHNPAPRLITRDLSFRPSDTAETIAAALREYLGISLEEQLRWRNPETALEHWRQALLGAGVYVFKDQFRAATFSGFCLYDDEFPIIYVNNTTTKTRQIFTLFHELAHLLFHTSGIDTRDDDYIDELSRDNRRIEVICNRLSAAFLVPEGQFEQAFRGRPATRQTAEELALLFSVSRESIYRKFLDRGLISEEEYTQAARRWAGQKKSGSWGNPYYTKIAYLGPEYINLAFSRFYRNQISESQLADYLDMKPKHVSTLEDYISRRV